MSRRTHPPLALLVGGCFALAALSLILPTALDKDPWCWVVWGREVAHLALDTSAGSSWKPLPVLFTTPLSAFGDAAPELWLVVARAGGLLAILFAYRIAARLGGRLAGALAALCVVGADWARYLAHGNIEPLSAGLLLAAVDRHLDGHRHQAMLLGALAALGRVELWPFLVLYALFVFFATGTRRVVAVVLVVAVPALWLGGDWWGSGDPFHGSHHARGFQQRVGQRERQALRRAAQAGQPAPKLATTGSATSRAVSGAGDLLVPPALAAALVGIAFALRRRERVPLVLAGGALGLFGLVMVMAALGYGGSPRFLFPAMGPVAVLAGLGVAWLLGAAAGSGHSAGGRRRAVLSAALAALLVAATVPFAVARVRDDERRLKDAGERARLQDGLDLVVGRAGGSRVLPLGRPGAPGQFRVQLAWELGVHLREVGAARPPAVVFVGPPSKLVGEQPRIPRNGVRVRLLAAAAGWRAVAVARAPR